MIDYTTDLKRALKAPRSLFVLHRITTITFFIFNINDANHTITPLKSNYQKPKE